MNCLFCDFYSHKQNNTFNPPTEKTYFISLEDYNSYMKQKNINNKEISNVMELFPNDKDNNMFIKEDKNRKTSITNGRGALHRKVIFISKDYHNIKYPNLSISCYSLKNPSNLKNEIILLRIRNKCFDIINNKYKKNKSRLNISKETQEDSNGKIKNVNLNNSIGNDNFSVDSESIEKTKITLLISHSNNTDLGEIFPKLCDFATILKCDVISYDYSGYGCSNCKTNYQSLKNDLITVLNFISNTLEIKNENIILLSFNIGAIPSIYAASISKYCSIRGMILVSPLLDFVKKFKYDCINEVICPVFIIQGDYEENFIENEIKVLSKKFQESIHWIPKNVKNYQEIMDENIKKFYYKIRKFLKHVQTTRFKITQSLADSTNSNILKTIK